MELNTLDQIHDSILSLSTHVDDLSIQINGINARIEAVENVLKTEAVVNLYRRILEEAQKQQYSIKDNASRLDNMMKELKGIVAMVRPSAAKNPWYQNDREVPGQIVTKTLAID